MPRSCTICTHKARADIDGALLAGATLRVVASRFESSLGSVQRHKAHISAALTLAHEAVQVADADDLLARVRALEAKATRIGDAAEQAGDLRTALQGVREQTRIIGLLVDLASRIAEQQLAEQGGVAAALAALSDEELVAKSEALVAAFRASAAGTIVAPPD